VRVYQFRHIRADGQCSAVRASIFGLNRGLLVLAALGLALPFCVASAGASRPAARALVEQVVLLRNPSLARTGLALHTRKGSAYLAAVTRQQRQFETRLTELIPGASVRWRYQVVLDGLAVVAPESAAARIAAIPGVARVYPSVRYQHALFRSPQTIGAPQVWGPTLANAGQGVKIGIIDDGVDQAHPFFSPTGFTMPPGFPKGQTAYTSAKVIVARSFPPPGLKYRYAKLPFDPVESEHGTHVAGIAAGDYGTLADDGQRTYTVSGIAPRAYIGNYRIGTIPTNGYGLDGNSPEIAAAIEQAVKDGMDVINISYGEPEITPSRDVVVQAINGAAAAGVVPVISAGNDFDALGFGTIGSPASAAKAITVAAASKGGTIARFSSAGPTPYSLMLKPDVSAPGVSILSSVPAHDGLWDYFDGTSMASPHVAGAAAVLRQRHPAWTVAQIKSALVLTGNPVRGSAGREVLPTREGGGMIWLPRADQPLLFASPTSISLGYLRRGHARRLRIRLADAGGGAGAWQVSIRRMVTTRGVRLSTPSSVTVPGRVALRASASTRAAAGDSSGFLVLEHAGEVRRIPYWLHVSARRLAREPYRRLPAPGVYHGDTRRGKSLVSRYRFPDHPGALGVPERLSGPEQVFRFVLRRRVANAGAVILSQGPGRNIRVSPRLVRAGDEDRIAGYTGLPIRINPYQARYFGKEPVVGVFRPNPGAYDLVFDTPRGRAPGPFTFRFWVNDTTPPTARLLARSVRKGGRLALVVHDRGSGVDPLSLLALVDKHYRPILYRPSTGRVEVVLGRKLTRGRHTLELSVADYQETKNNENAAGTRVNTRRLSATFSVH
jgi:subtilisin family serine protease